MSTSSAPRADTFGATSGDTTTGTSAPGFEVHNLPNGPNSFLSTVLRVVQGSHSLVLGSFKELLAD